MSAERQYVVYRLEGQLYGAAIDVVREVKTMTPVTRLPNTPHFVDGVIDLRGEILPVVDLRKRLAMPSREPDAETRLMILSLGTRSAALVVDGVDQVLTLREEEIVAPDAHVTMAGQDYLVGVARTGEKLIIIMDLDKLMNAALV